MGRKTGEESEKRIIEDREERGRRGIMNKIQKLGCNYGSNHPFDGISTACKAALIDVMNATSGINTYNTYGICYGPEPFP